MAFHEVRFPPAWSFGSSGGPERRTEIVTLGSGFEARNTPWALSRRRYEAGVGLRSLDDLHALAAFFEARGGRLHGFRWKDHLDWKSCPPLQAVSATDQALGVGDGVRTSFELVKRYGDDAASYVRRIAKPVAGSVLVAVDGVAVGFDLDAASGVVTLDAAPGLGAAVSAGFEFDVPVRFDTDRLAVNVTAFRAGEALDVPVVEVRV